ALLSDGGPGGLLERAGLPELPRAAGRAPPRARPRPRAGPGSALEGVSMKPRHFLFLLAAAVAAMAPKCSDSQCVQLRAAADAACSAGPSPACDAAKLAVAACPAPKPSPSATPAPVCTAPDSGPWCSTLDARVLEEGCFEQASARANLCSWVCKGAPVFEDETRSDPVSCDRGFRVCNPGETCGCSHRPPGQPWIALPPCPSP